MHAAAKTLPNHRTESFFMTTRPHLLEGGSSAIDPADILRPSGSVTVLALARFEPSLARAQKTVTVSPTLKISRDQPSRRSTFGLASSRFQFSTWPSGPFTSM